MTAAASASAVLIREVIEAKWSGAGFGLAGSYELARAERQVLLGEDPPVNLTQRANHALRQVREAHLERVHPAGTVIIRDSGGQMRSMSVRAIPGSRIGWPGRPVIVREASGTNQLSDRYVASSVPGAGSRHVVVSMSIPRRWEGVLVNRPAGRCRTAPAGRDARQVKHRFSDDLGRSSGY